MEDKARKTSKAVLTVSILKNQPRSPNAFA